jgi:hypothetical protein
MTKRTLVILPCLAVALVFLGCSTGGEAGSGGQAAPSGIAGVYSDPYEEGLALGYVSTVAADFSGDPEAYMAQQAQYGQEIQAEPVSRQIFETPQLNQKVAPNQVGATTLAPIGMQQAPGMTTDLPTAKDEGNGMITVTSGSQTAHLLTFTGPDGVTQTASVGSNGIATLNGEDTFPKLMEVPGVGRAVILASGTVVMVE